MEPILELGDLTPEHKPIRINRVVEEFDGKNSTKEYKTSPIVLQAFLYGPRCPVMVKAQLHQVSKRYQDEVAANGFSNAAFQAYVRDSLLGLVPGLQFDEADLIASDDNVYVPGRIEQPDGKAIKTLKYLNYWMIQAKEEDAPNPETVKEDTPIMEESSPISS